MTLLSSIGVERQSQFPFLILNLFGVLDAKLESEKVFAKRVKEIGSKSIIVRPGRLVGAPFTNTGISISMISDIPFTLLITHLMMLLILTSLVWVRTHFLRFGQIVTGRSGN